jgi:hypothetical protein
MLKRLLKPFARRYRSFMQAEIMAELAAMRAERNGLADLQKTLTAVEEALLTLALQKS